MKVPIRVPAHYGGGRFLRESSRVGGTNESGAVALSRALQWLNAWSRVMYQWEKVEVGTVDAGVNGCECGKVNRGKGNGGIRCRHY
jgi:hypothetical protein